MCKKWLRTYTAAALRSSTKWSMRISPVLSVERPMAPRPVLGHTSTTRARNIAGGGGGGGGEWSAAPPLPPPGDSHMCSPGVDLGTGGGLSLKSTKISYQKNYAKKVHFRN